MKNTKNKSAQEILSTLTIDEKIRLLNGVGPWHTYDADKKIPSVMMTDGPHGLRKQEDNQIDINDSAKATCFPTASCIANSWDLDLIKEMSGAIADQALQEGVGIVLGCGMNIKRSPMCGRNFEYFSEDPLLAGSLATAYIDGMQSKNVGTSIKHFACNNQETRRQTSDSIVDERALREIYLRPFEIAVRNVQPTTIMASYNKINGKYTCQNKKIITDILRGEWGFKGTVISDWGAAMSMPDCVKAGLDLAMPDSHGYQIKLLRDAYDKGELTEQEIDRACLKVIEVVLKTTGVKKTTVDYKKAHDLAKKIAANSAVLLKNDGLLPLSKKQKEILVIGQMADDVRIQGGGSSHINAFTSPNVIESLTKKGFKVKYVAGYPGDDVVEQTEPTEIQRMAQEAVVAAKEASDKNIPTLFFCGLTNRTEGEGFDRKDMNLPHEQLSVINKIIEMNKDLIVVLFGGSPFAVPFADNVNAMLHMYLAGEASAEACADLLTGTVNPSGKLSETYPFSENDLPCAGNWGNDSPSVEYRESIFTGYRYYETFDVPVKYEFGYGLSYTKFKYSGLEISSATYNAADADEAIGNVGAACGYGEKLSKSKTNLKVKFTVKNSGKVAGAEVVQLYVKNPASDYIRPVKELRAFTKVYLEPGKSKKITIELDAKAFSLYDVSTQQYIAPTGTYEIEIGSSVKDIKLKKSVKVKGVKYERDDKSKLSSYFRKIKLFTHADFVSLYGKDFPVDLEPTPGTFTIYNSFSEAAKLNKTCKKILDGVIEKIKANNRKLGRSDNDPALKIVIGGLTENPLEGMVLLAGDDFKRNRADFIVNLVNKKRFAALKSLWSKKWD
ncbi:glycoside hydrolase family 3 C-terminal domain-containing protein [Treponema sp.]|uniref:glycoside hydrolase family 3 C-terminal domain-containing protein n=1 Tax=Treponema sp. TaxID=166 RepID=UPI00298D6A6C|nr:glycoside hydrolase family 3 C-terminal domain-containing protein [Treponema sp.]